MCGIVGGISERDVVPIILEGLSRLEYRGYDSIGIAVIDQNNNLARKRATNRVKHLAEICNNKKLSGKIGIGHTRWATHGNVSTENAHPHISGNIAIVHNGIIENYAQVKQELTAHGYIFESETDTEVIVHLIHFLYNKMNNFLLAIKEATTKLHGTYAIAVICTDLNQIFLANMGAPIVLGIGINEIFFASDVLALLPITRQFIYIEEEEIAAVNLTNWQIFDKEFREVIRGINTSSIAIEHTELGSFRHFMQKEIFEQPQAIADTLQYLEHSFEPNIFGEDAAAIFKAIDKIQIVACGTSFNASMVAKYWFEDITGLECSVDIASEYRYSQIPVRPNTLIISISQSGETADTLACIRHVQSLGMKNTLAICNVASSSLVRLSKLHILTKAGVEIGVASTKAFTTQLVVLLYLIHTINKVRQGLRLIQEIKILDELRLLPGMVREVLKLEEQIKDIAVELEYKHHALFLGRNTLYPIAQEGALKIKEISYIHAESYASGELKHGPLALIDKNMPSFIMLSQNILFDKVKSNIEEILARHGIVYLFTDQDDSINDKCYKVIKLPKTNNKYLIPILYTIPLQLLAYYTAIAKGTDVDKPRNLAKSVTVE